MFRTLSKLGSTVRTNGDAVSPLVQAASRLPPPANEPTGGIDNTDSTDHHPATAASKPAAWAGSEGCDEPADHAEA